MTLTANGEKLHFHARRAVYLWDIHGKRFTRCLFFQLNKCLRENQKLWHDKVSQMEQKLQETETHSKQVKLNMRNMYNSRKLYGLAPENVYVCKSCLMQYSNCSFFQEIQDLQEQINDLMRHFETQQAIACAPEETKKV